MANVERFQMHCRHCCQRFEADTIREALRKVEEHEREKHGPLQKLQEVRP